MFSKKNTWIGIGLSAGLLFVVGCGSEPTTTTTAPPAEIMTQEEIEQQNAHYAAPPERDRAQ